MMVGRFYGVHAVLEPEMGRHLDPALLAGRQKLSLLIEDLQTLGMSAGEIPALPTCTALNEVVDTADGALGALYVLEGSTLGGKVITRLLRQSPVWPIKGIRYFDPYGSETGQMWRSFKIYLSSIGEADRQDRIVCGAKATFSLMEGWLRPAFPTPQ